MPNTKFLQIKINNQFADIGDIDQLGMVINYILEEPEDFLSRQGSDSLGLTLPATRTNDKIFNTFWKPEIEDTTSDGSYRTWMDIEVYVGGTIILKGSCLLQEANVTDKPESYVINIYGNSGTWIIDMQNVTLWDCLNTTSHNFDLATVVASWGNFNSDEHHDYVYAPVRYRQPFDGTTLGYQGDNCVNIYHLRPSISIYWIIIRAFRQFGYTVKSQFFNTQYFQRLVMPWTWGDFYDIDSQLVQGVCFKAAGRLPDATEPPPTTNSGLPFWSGNTTGTVAGSPGGSSWWFVHMASGGFNPAGYNPALGPASLTNGINPTGGVYVFNGSGTTAGSNDWFRMDIDNPPNGYDNFMLYSFDEATGKMIYDFNPPASIVSYTNISATFVISIYCLLTGTTSSQGLLALECTHIPAVGPTVVTCQSIMPSGGAVIGATHYPDNSGYPTTPTVSNFTVSNLNPGDRLEFRLRAIDDGTSLGVTFGIFSGGYLNNNPSVIGVPTYAYNPLTQQFGFITPNSIWSPLQSSLTMTGFLVQLGNPINFQNYDAFRNHKFTDMLGGLVEAFNLDIQTDAINKEVTINPMFGMTLATGETIDGYFKTGKVLDWTAKKDRNKSFKNSLFNGMERQLDFSMKQDGSDGGQNIWGSRYKNVYLNNVLKSKLNNTNIENGITAGVPGASRYMLPDRFAKGNRQFTNRFFSSTMHCLFPQWENLDGLGSPAPQLICIFPENISGSSADAITQTFEPKIAWYEGQVANNIAGGWIFIGDPAAPYSGGLERGIALPYMYSVNYKPVGQFRPVLSYSDENINGIRVKGLMSQFFLQRLAIIRNGQLVTSNMRLNLNDICNWEHQEIIKIENSMYALISIDSYNPLSDESNECKLWRLVKPEQIDVDNCYPSSTAILVNPLTLPQYDLRYARLLLYPTDLPQIS